MRREPKVKHRTRLFKSIRISKERDRIPIALSLFVEMFLELGADVSQQPHNRTDSELITHAIDEQSTQHSTYCHAQDEGF